MSQWLWIWCDMKTAPRGTWSTSASSLSSTESMWGKKSSACLRDRKTVDVEFLVGKQCNRKLLMTYSGVYLILVQYWIRIARLDSGSIPFNSALFCVYCTTRQQQFPGLLEPNVTVHEEKLRSVWRHFRFAMPTSSVFLLCALYCLWDEMHIQWNRDQRRERNWSNPN